MVQTYKAIIDSISIPFLVLDDKLKVSFANKEALTILNLDNKNFADADFVGLAQIPEEQKQQMSKNQLSKDKTGQFNKFKSEKGDIFYSIKPIDLPLTQSHGFFVEFKLDQKEGCTMDQVASLGEYSGKIAKDVTNPLTVIKVTCESLKFETTTCEMMPARDVAEKVQKIERAADQVDKCNHKLKEFSGKLKTAEVTEVLNIAQFADSASFFTDLVPDKK